MRIHPAPKFFPKILVAMLLNGVAPFAEAQTTQASAEAQPASQWVLDIRQRDSSERRLKALADVRAALGDGNPAAAQAAALMALARTADIKFDRSGLEDQIAPLLQSASADVRRAALTALPDVKPGAERIEQVAALAKDPDPRVRAAVMQAIVSIRVAANNRTPVGEPALVLLSDKDQDVVVQTAGSLWAVPITPEVEAKAIELSRFPKDEVPAGKSIPYWMNYLLLSTRPQVSKPVAQRLAEIARNPRLDQNWTGRAVWGLAHAAAPDAADTVTQALIEELNNSLLPYNREWAVRGLAGARTEAAMKKLQEVAAATDETDSIRKLASDAVSRK